MGSPKDNRGATRTVRNLPGCDVDVSVALVALDVDADVGLNTLNEVLVAVLLEGVHEDGRWGRHFEVVVLSARDGRDVVAVLTGHIQDSIDDLVTGPLLIIAAKLESDGTVTDMRRRTALNNLKVSIERQHHFHR